MTQPPPQRPQQPGQPPYGAPQSGQPQYGPPPQGQPPGQPQYGPPHGHPQQGQPQYGTQPPPYRTPSEPGAWQTADFDNHTSESVRGQVFDAVGNAQPSRSGGGTMFTEPVLVVSQRTKLIELNNEYRVFDQHGNPLGTVVQVGQSALKKAIRFIGEYDQFFTHTLEVRNLQGQPMMKLTRPRKVFKSRLLVESPNGPIGEIVQQNVFGKIKFDMVAGGQSIGSINAENWRAWNFAILDGSGREVGRITKNFEGVARTLFTTADNYVVQIHFQLPDPLRSMVIAAALCVDTALKQDSRGFN